MYNVIKMSKHEFEDKYGTEVEDVSLKSADDVVSIFMSEDDDCPFIGCSYKDGTYSITGCGCDNFCTYGNMVDVLSES